ncbi:GNAT family N-acetyltransferase [Deinococcus cavernae]|uniref:GNAT family N-acetyltransferase n=1 Tax=Deinococcus cavernae TaxID=2320857 RepID=A0A418V6M5_9DEIO|nr:GNAT family N-acetyltransferase [Deinococcus cavernae]
MNTYHIEQATPATLSDIYALHDPADAARRLPALQKRVAEGKTSADRFWLLRSERGVEGVVNLTARPEIPLFPRYRADTPAAHVTAFLKHLKELVSGQPEQQLILDSQLVPLNPAPAEAARWVLDDSQAVYETTLSSLPVRFDAGAQKVDQATLDSPALRRLLSELGRGGWELQPDWTLVMLTSDAGEPVALGAAGPSGRPGYAGIDLIGVHPNYRRQGYGTRLHAHLLTLAAEEFEMHGGGTPGENHAMRRIFDRNGSRQLSDQLYFRQA